MEIRKISTEEIKYIYNQFMVEDFSANESNPLNTIKTRIQSGL